MIEEESNAKISCLMSLGLQDQGASDGAVFRREAWNDPDPPMRMTVWGSGAPVTPQHVTFQCLKHQALLLLKLLVTSFESVERRMLRSGTWENKHSSH
jgi:hypothetical protein